MFRSTLQPHSIYRL